jgi:3-oxoacyl-(acyl-carrier-protein) synthase
VGAALEALGTDASQLGNGGLRLGIVLCVMSGCVNYSRRFYDETLKDPTTASPVVFPETVFNSPASHLAALLGTDAINYTLVGDPGSFLQGVALAADWLVSERVDGCLVVGAEEIDWLTTEAFRLFDRTAVVSDGAGALYLRRKSNNGRAVRLEAITQAHSFSKKQSRVQAAERARKELGGGGEESLLCDGLQGVLRLDRPEIAAWKDWAGSRLSPKRVLGEGLMAAAAWQCVAAVDALEQNQYNAAVVSLVGCNQQAIAARFVRAAGTPAT